MEMTQRLFGLWEHVSQRTLLSSLLMSVSKPWEALAQLGSAIAVLGAQLSGEEYTQIQPGVWAANSARISPSAHLTGPCIIGHDTEIRPGALIRGNVCIGSGAVVGNSSELKNCILFDGVQVPHFNYVGDSILGYRAHLGAGAITSNVKSDRSEISCQWEGERLPTGRYKVGAMLGDFVEIGCHTVLNPGTIIGSNTIVYPCLSVRGFVEEDCIYKGDGTIVKRQLASNDPATKTKA